VPLAALQTHEVTDEEMEVIPSSGEEPEVFHEAVKAKTVTKTKKEKVNVRDGINDERAKVIDGTNARKLPIEKTTSKGYVFLTFPYLPALTLITSTTTGMASAHKASKVPGVIKDWRSKIEAAAAAPPSGPATKKSTASSSRSTPALTNASSTASSSLSASET